MRCNFMWKRSTFSELECRNCSLEREQKRKKACSKYMLLFHITLEHIKPIYYDLISNFSKYYFKTGTICLLFSSSLLFTAWKNLEAIILVFFLEKQQNHNEIKPPIPKILQKYKPIRHYFEMPRRAHLQTKFAIIIRRYSTFKRIKNYITWKPLFRRKSTYLSRLDLLEAIT